MKSIFINLSYVFFAFYPFGSVFAQSGQGIESFSLDGQWEVVFDDDNIGVAEKWYIDENFDSHASKQIISVPSALETIKENYEGAAFYRKIFTIPKHWSGQIIELNFDAVNYKSEIWLNGEAVGFHEGGYNPFSFRIDKLVEVGKQNTLVVRVITPIILSNKNIDGLGRQEVPMWRGAINGGIWQSVSLVAKKNIAIRDVFLESDIRKKTLDVSLELFNVEVLPANATLQIDVFSKDNQKVASSIEGLNIQPGKTQIRNILRFSDVTLWDTENPYLYRTLVTLKSNDEISDQWTHKFGFREFTVKNEEFYLNGNPIYLKAAFFEGLYPVGLAYPDSREMAIKEIKLAKGAGFNMIRPWRKPPPKIWLELCDEMGVLVVGSLVVECMYRPVSTPRLSFVVENKLRKTILSNRNRTSIVQ